MLVFGRECVWGAGGIGGGEGVNDECENEPARFD